MPPPPVMIDPHRYRLFMGAALVLLLTPGPAVLYVVSRSMEHGVRAGVVAALGLVAGGSVHMATVVLGLSALLSASAGALTLLRWVGAGYLLWLSWRELSARAERAGAAEGAPARVRELFTGGVMVNLLNPKAALFFLAFLPQFVDPTSGDVRVQLLFLGGSFLGLALVTDTGYAALGGRAGRLLRRPALRAGRRWLSAALYAGLGVAAALEGRRP
jgi:threonine/homoserine/homoserine lactone efflux protein